MMKKRWVKNGLIGLATFVVLDALFVVITLAVGEKCMGDVCFSLLSESNTYSLILSVLIWPASLVKSNLLRLVLLGVYYFVVGVLIGWIWRMVRNWTRTV